MTVQYGTMAKPNLHGSRERPVQRLVAGYLLLLAGCCSTHYRPRVYAAASPAAPPCSGVVFVANGSGDFRTVSTNLGKVLTETSTPLQLETITWSLGFGRYVSDHVDHANHLEQGAQLADRVCAYR